MHCRQLQDFVVPTDSFLCSSPTPVTRATVVLDQSAPKERVEEFTPQLVIRLRSMYLVTHELEVCAAPERA
jgi:hypothetical protein